MIDQGAVVDVGSFLVVVTAAALGGTIAGVAGGRGWLVPAVVCELVLGVVVGPQLLGLAKVTSFIDFFANLGLGMLFFFAGYEIDVRRIKGEPLKLAVLAWPRFAGAGIHRGRTARRDRDRAVAPCTRGRRWPRRRSAR